MLPLLLAVGNRRLNTTSSKADGGLFCLLYTGGFVQSFTTDAYFQVIAVRTEWRLCQDTDPPCLNLLPIVVTSLEVKVYREKRVRKKLFLLISNSSRIFPCFHNKWKQHGTELTSFASDWCFWKKAGLVSGCPWDGRIAFAFKPGTLGIVESKREMTSHVPGFLEFSWITVKLHVEQGSYDRKCTHVSLAPLINVQRSLWFRVSQSPSKKLTHPRDHHILWLYLHSGPLIQSPEDQYLNKGNPERVCL